LTAAHGLLLLEANHDIHPIKIQLLTEKLSTRGVSLARNGKILNTKPPANASFLHGFGDARLGPLAAHRLPSQ
jgi:hypothetical protein